MGTFYFVIDRLKADRESYKSGEDQRDGFTVYGHTRDNVELLNEKRVEVIFVDAPSKPASEETLEQYGVEALTGLVTLKPNLIGDKWDWGSEINEEAPVKAFLFIRNDLRRLKDKIKSEIAAGCPFDLFVYVNIVGENPLHLGMDSFKLIDFSESKEFAVTQFDIKFANQNNIISQPPRQDAKSLDVRFLASSVELSYTLTNAEHVSDMVSIEGLTSANQAGIVNAKSYLFICEFEKKDGQYPREHALGEIRLYMGRDGLDIRTSIYVTRRVLQQFADHFAAATKGDPIVFELSCKYDRLPEADRETQSWQINWVSWSIQRKLLMDDQKRPFFGR